MAEHPSQEAISGSEIVIGVAIDYAEHKKRIPSSVAKAISILFAYDSIANTSCTQNCYNINIVMVSNDTTYDLYQIKYHFSGGAETLGRYSEYKLNGTNQLVEEADYNDYVSDRSYKVYLA